jgi:hypothetical protein
MSISSYLNISLETANKLYSWGWKASLIGAAITLIGVTLLMWGTRVRDHDFESKISDTISAAAQANERAATLSKQAAEVQLDLEHERVQRLKLEAQMAPRSLTREQTERMVGALKQVPAPVAIIVERQGEQEASRYASMIVIALRAAGITVHETGGGISSPPPYGLMLGISADDPKGHAIKAAFESAGISITLRVGNVAGGNAYLLVGLKPL